LPKPILVDHRWGSNPSACGVVAEDLFKLGYHPLVRQLTTGDFVFGVQGFGRVGIEMKEVRDLLVSHVDGRLDDELFRLQRDCALACLLIVGPLGCAADIPAVGGFTWTAVDNLIAGRQMRGIVVLRCDHDGIADRIAAWDKYLSRQPQRLVRPRRQHLPYMGKMTERAEVVYSLLASVKGVRDKSTIAARLADSKPLSEIFSMEVNAWREQGFSKLMAERLSAHVREV
jgi:ERCC4-type nuclease